MNIKTKTIETIVGYEAFDGTYFKTEDECMKYEDSAFAAAKKAAWHYLVANREGFDLFNDAEMGLYVFDIPDTRAYEIILHWGDLAGVHDLCHLTPAYIGQRVAIRWQDWDAPIFLKQYATKESMMAYYAKCIEDIFADPKTT